MSFQLFEQLYLLIQYGVVAILLFLIFVMALQLIFNFADPNPFTQLGKFSAWLADKTHPFVSPIEMWLGSRRFDRRFAPFVTVLIACLLGYFVLRVVSTVTTSLDGIVLSAASGRFVALIGFALYGFLGLLSLAIFARIILSWAVVYGNKFTRFFTIVTDPVLVPFRRLIPPIGGMLDVSPIIVVVLINLFQEAIRGTLIAPGA